jgi:UPF0716 family protein affecting phage T7 exclusion
VLLVSAALSLIKPGMLTDVVGASLIGIVVVTQLAVARRRSNAEIAAI